VSSFLVIVPVMAFANRVRGGLFGDAPVRWLFIVSAVMAAGLGVVYGWGVGAAWGVAFTLWGLRGWGRWYDLGRLPEGYARPGPAAPWSFEWCIEHLAEPLPLLGGGLHKDHWCLILRHLLIVPALCIPAYTVGPVWIWLTGGMAAGLIVTGYEVGWQLYERGYTREPTGIGEWLAGAVWGVLISAAVMV